MLPACLKLPVPGSDNQDFTSGFHNRLPPGPIQPQRCCSSKFGGLVEIHFHWNDFVSLLVRDCLLLLLLWSFYKINSWKKKDKTSSVNGGPLLSDI